jgi:hypothetical protein
MEKWLDGAVLVCETSQRITLCNNPVGVDAIYQLSFVEPAMRFVVTVHDTVHLGVIVSA